MEKQELQRLRKARMIRQEWSEVGLSVRQQKICQNQIAVVGMVEDVKTKGGSSYVTQKVRNIAVSYLQ